MTERAIPVTIFEAEIAVKCTFLHKWMSLKDRAMSEEEISSNDTRAVAACGHRSPGLAMGA